MSTMYYPIVQEILSLPEGGLMFDEWCDSAPSEIEGIEAFVDFWAAFRPIAMGPEQVRLLAWSDDEADRRWWQAHGR